MAFVRASKKRAKLRLALQGPSGTGKTYTALSIATHLVDPGQLVCVLDTEKGSADKYGSKFTFEVDSVTDNYHPDKVSQAIKDAAAMGAGVLIVDSMTHFWNGPGGFLELVDDEVERQKARRQRPDSFAAWKVVDKVYSRMIHDILTAPLHVICTLRAKTEYQRSEGDNGKARIEKVGLAPQIRDTFQYEMDIEGMLDMDHTLVIGKTRCEALDGGVYRKPGKNVSDILRAWLTDGEEPAPPPAPTVTVTINNRQHVTAGIERDDLLRVWNLSAALEKAGGKGAAKDVMLKTANVDTSLKLTAETGKAVIAALREACGAAGVDPDAEVAA